MFGMVPNLFSAINELIPSNYETPLADTIVISLNYLTKHLCFKAKGKILLR